jgi:hypothetical protein
MKKIFQILFLVSTLLSFSQVCTAVNGNWNNSSTWSCNHIPTGGETINIPSGVTVVVSGNLTVPGSSVLLNIFGTLDFDNGSKINFPTGSIIHVFIGGAITGTGGGSSNNIEIGITEVWKIANGNLSGEIVLSENIPLQLPNKNDLPVTDKVLVLSIYPNPSEGEINLSVIGSPLATIKIFKLTGEIVVEYKSNENKIYLDKGIYIVKVFCLNNIITEKIVIN